MRGSQGLDAKHIGNLGIIPAHAGLTLQAATSISGGRDHPRACGAHSSNQPPMSAGEGSSPRMRGSHEVTRLIQPVLGIIPAHAGLTYHMFRPKNLQRDHPRACGAHRA